MLRSSLTLAGLVAFGATAQAQQAPTLNTSKQIPITGAIRDAGIYHQATNTWTRKSAQADIGADIIYSNTLPTGYFYGLTLDTFIDEGRIPSPTSPTQTAGLQLSRPGCATSYTIDGVRFTYCTLAAAGGNFTLNFYGSYIPCATVISVTPTGTAVIAGPSTPADGTQICWVVTVDLDPANDFVMLADGDGAFNGNVTPGPAAGTPGAGDRFGWSMFSPLVSTFPEGPVGAGFLGFNVPDSTVWDSPVNYLEEGTGMSTADQFRIEGGPFTPGCYFFGGGAQLASFGLELFADACAVPPPGVGFCFGDGTGLSCPTVGCAGGPFNGATGNGCGNSLFPTVGANLAGTGTASISADTVVLVATNTPNASVLFFQGTVQAGSPPGNGTLFGDGKRCAGGTVIRLGTKTAALNTTSYPQGADQSVSVRGAVTPGIRTYQAWYRNAAAFCTASTFNLSNGYQITWGA